MRKKETDFVAMVEQTPEADIIIGMALYRFRTGFHTQTLIVGARGTGKSSTCQRLSELYNQEMNPIREKLGLSKKIRGKTVDTVIGLIEFCKNAEMGDDAVVEEVSVLYPSRRAMSSENVAVGQLFDVIRKKRLTLWLNCPILTSTDANIRTSSQVLVETFKILKEKSVVISRFWKLQTNTQTGKVYKKKFHRGKKAAKYMFTSMPDEKAWEDYNKDKDKFIDELYMKLLVKQKKKDDKDSKDLANYDPTKGYRRELTEKQEEVMRTIARCKSQTEAAKLLGMNDSQVSIHKKGAMKKGYNISEFRD